MVIDTPGHPLRVLFAPRFWQSLSVMRRTLAESAEPWPSGCVPTTANARHQWTVPQAPSKALGSGARDRMRLFLSPERTCMTPQAHGSRDSGSTNKFLRT